MSNDDKQRELLAEALDALQGLHDDVVEYVTLNKLHDADGSPAINNHWMRRARAAISAMPQRELLAEAQIPDRFTKWDGGECPVPVGTRIGVFYRGHLSDSPHIWEIYGTETPETWTHDGSSADIIAYRIIEASTQPVTAGAASLPGGDEESRDQLQRELLREALEALEPFAAQQAEWSYRLPDTQGFGVICLSSPADGTIVFDADMTMGDLRRARAAADKIRAALTQEKQT